MRRYFLCRFKNGWDEELQKSLLEPRSDEEAALRDALAVRWGKSALPGAGTENGQRLRGEVPSGTLNVKQNNLQDAVRILTQFKF